MTSQTLFFKEREKGKSYSIGILCNMELGIKPFLIT